MDSKFYSQTTLGNDPNLPEDVRAPIEMKSKHLHYCSKVWFRVRLSRNPPLEIRN